jgi:predicted RNA-binding protein YlxR (DUF448 family)/ribosomal protein L7Ae-like RNA K-turn-binding protein
MRSATHLHRTGRRVPTRTCVGCGQRGAASELLRLVVEPADGDPAAGTPRDAAKGAPGIVFDLAGGSFGRGAHVHARLPCLSRAPRGLSRAFRLTLAVDTAELGRRLVAACDRRMCGLLLAARRLESVAVGTSASLDAIRSGASLAIVAVDAPPIASVTEVAGAIAAGRAIAWKEKSELGGLLGHEAVAICAVRHEAIAAELKRICAAATVGAAMREGDECSRRPEAR